MSGGTMAKGICAFIAAGSIAAFFGAAIQASPFGSGPLPSGPIDAMTVGQSFTVEHFLTSDRYGGPIDQCKVTTTHGTEEGSNYGTVPNAYSPDSDAINNSKSFQTACAATFHPFPGTYTLIKQGPDKFTVTGGTGRPDAVAPGQTLVLHFMGTSKYGDVSDTCRVYTTAGTEEGLSYGTSPSYTGTNDAGTFSSHAQAACSRTFGPIGGEYLLGPGAEGLAVIGSAHSPTTLANLQG